MASHVHVVTDSLSSPLLQLDTLQWWKALFWKKDENNSCDKHAVGILHYLDVIIVHVQIDHRKGFGISSNKEEDDRQSHWH